MITSCNAWHARFFQSAKSSPSFAPLDKQFGISAIIEGYIFTLPNEQIGQHHRRYDRVMFKARKIQDTKTPEKYGGCDILTRYSINYF